MIDTFEMTDLNGTTTYVRIVNGDTATIMTKAEYDKEQLPPIVEETNP